MFLVPFLANSAGILRGATYAVKVRTRGKSFNHRWAHSVVTCTTELFSGTVADPGVLVAVPSVYSTIVAFSISEIHVLNPSRRNDA